MAKYYPITIEDLKANVDEMSITEFGEPITIFDIKRGIDSEIKTFKKEVPLTEINGKPIKMYVSETTGEITSPPKARYGVSNIDANLLNIMGDIDKELTLLSRERKELKFKRQELEEQKETIELMLEDAETREEKADLFLWLMEREDELDNIVDSLENIDKELSEIDEKELKLIAGIMCSNWKENGDEWFNKYKSYLQSRLESCEGEFCDDLEREMEGLKLAERYCNPKEKFSENLKDIFS